MTYPSELERAARAMCAALDISDWDDLSPIWQEKYRNAFAAGLRAIDWSSYDDWDITAAITYLTTTTEQTG